MQQLVKQQPHSQLVLVWNVLYNGHRFIFFFAAYGFLIE